MSSRLGLILSGTVDPGKVLGFLELAGPWDQSLALVKGGTVAVAAAGVAPARGLLARRTDASAGAGALTARLAGMGLFELAERWRVTRPPQAARSGTPRSLATGGGPDP